MKTVMKVGAKIGVIALIMLLLPNVPLRTLGSFAYATQPITVAPAPLNATELMDLFLYVNGSLATISERLNNMAKATDMNVREAAVVGEQVVLETVEQMGVRARSDLRSEG